MQAAASSCSTVQHSQDHCHPRLQSEKAAAVAAAVAATDRLPLSQTLMPLVTRS